MTTFVYQDGKYVLEDFAKLQEEVAQKKVVSVAFIHENQEKEQCFMEYDGVNMNAEKKEFAHALYSTGKSLKVTVSMWGEISVNLKDSNKALILCTSSFSTYYIDKKGRRCYVKHLPLMDEDAVLIEKTCKDCGFVFEDSSHFVGDYCSACAEYKTQKLVNN
ncbi:hypothetical protein U8V72_24680 [Priestia filamentosa]|uniref:hypothetical protein n=1 Tax=Priestia filamentosa TaxID=1402861 RepID=UPI00397B0124